MTPNEIVRVALFATPIDHLQKCFEMRNPGPASQGSVFHKEVDIDTLLGVEWEPLVHAAIKAPAKGFKTYSLPGRLGVVYLEDIDDMMLRVTESRKEPGKFEVVIDRATLPGGADALYTTLLVGPGGQGKDIVWTFFPGAPVEPTARELEDASTLTLTVEEALRLGFQYAKVEG